MARPKPTAADMERRKERAEQVKTFMKDYNFTEVRLAEVIGISRRSIQMIKAGAVTPTPDSIRKLNSLFARHGFVKAAK